MPNRNNPSDSKRKESSPDRDKERDSSPRKEGSPSSSARDNSPRKESSPSSSARDSSPRKEGSSNSSERDSSPRTEGSSSSSGKDSSQRKPSQGAGDDFNFRCSDVGYKDCNWQTRGRSEDEVMRNVEQHGKQVHHLDKLDDQTRNKIKGSIRRSAA